MQPRGSGAIFLLKTSEIQWNMEQYRREQSQASFNSTALTFKTPENCKTDEDTKYEQLSQCKNKKSVVGYLSFKLMLTSTVLWCIFGVSYSSTHCLFSHNKEKMINHVFDLKHSLHKDKVSREKMKQNRSRFVSPSVRKYSFHYSTVLFTATL